MEEHPLVKRFPEDTDWQHEPFEDLTLRKQCSVRNIPSDKTSREHMIRLLQEYQKTHITEVRKIPWRLSPDFVTGDENPTYQIKLFGGHGGLNESGFRKDFMFSEIGRTSLVSFKEIPTCTCGSQHMYHCVHIRYLLRYVLNCPDPLRWQAAFLPSELEIIYRHSHAVRTILLTNGKYKATTDTCVLCFQSLRGRKGQLVGCRHCGRMTHGKCMEAARRVRMLKEASCCWVCEDYGSAVFDAEKYREQNQIPAATIAGPVVTAPPTPTTNLIQQSIGRKGKDNHDMGRSSPSKKQDDRDTQVNNNPEVNQHPSHPAQSSAPFSSSSSNFPTPSQSAVNQQELLPPPSPQQPSQSSKDLAPQLKGSTSLPAVPLQTNTSTPLTSNQEPMRMDLKQQKEQERVGNPLRGVSQDSSPALAKSLSSVPSVQYPIPTASAARAHTVGQAGQTSALSADGVGSQNSAATAAGVLVQAVTPVLPDGSPGVVDSPSPVSNVDADVHRREAARLVRKYRRLEKETSHIREHAEREIKKIDKEYKRKLKRLEEKRKRIDKKREQGLKKLGLKRERLEKELKAFERS